MLVGLLLLVCGTIFAVLACRGLDPKESRFALASFALHVVSSFGQWAIGEFYYGVSDAHGFMEAGQIIARLLDYDFMQYGPETLKYALHLDTRLPFEPAGGTATTTAIAGLFVFLIGPELLNSCLLTTCISWAGQLLFYRAVRDEVPAENRTPVLVGFLLVPSVVYWGGGFAKEALVMGGFGLLGLSTYRLLRQRRPQHLLGAAFGGLVVAMIKPYVLFPFVVATAAWVYAASGLRRGRVVFSLGRLVLAAALAVGGLAVMGTLFPEYSADKVADSMASQQERWQQNAEQGLGGSNVELGSGEARTLGQQLQYIPAATVNALFRPTIVEARNATQFGAAIEMTFFTLGVLSLLGTRSRKIALRSIRESPLMLFCITFVACFAVAVGLATSNLGSLSRYRVPMMPFYATVILMVRHLRRVADASQTELVAGARPQNA